MSVSRPSGISKGSFRVVVGPGDRTSIWPSKRTLPGGWTDTGVAGNYQQCVAAISGQKPEPVDPSHRVSPPTRTLDFSMMFFGDSEQLDGASRYQLLLDATDFADQNGFASIWLPERHFTQFGCLYPDPATLHAALAMRTNRLSLRAGSVVMPLHDPLRVAESWSVVDNLSGGRVELAFASGWHANDFSLMPQNYDDRSEAMMRGIDSLTRLWSGKTIDRTNGNGDQVSLRTYPTPVQPELPIWLTAAGNPQTFANAGRRGYGVLTHLFNQDIETLETNIAIYRDALRAAGHPDDRRRVAVTLHTMVGDDMDQVRQLARAPYCRYLKNNFGLLKQLAISQGQSMDTKAMSEQDLETMLHYLFEKFSGQRSLMGTVDSCRDTCQQLADIGVTEVACLLDFGPDRLDVIKHLSQLNEVRRSFDAHDVA